MSDKTCMILGNLFHYKPLVLQKTARILQKVQEMQGFGRIWPETSDLSISPARYTSSADQTFPCNIPSANLQDFSVLAR